MSLYRLGRIPGRITSRQQRAPVAPSVCAASSRLASNCRVVFATTRTIWKNVPIQMMAIFGPSSIPSIATHSAEGRRRHVADEVDERLPPASRIGRRFAKDAQRQPDDRGQDEAPEDDLAVVPEALVQPRDFREEAAWWSAKCRRRRRPHEAPAGRPGWHMRPAIGAVCARELGILLIELCGRQHLIGFVAARNRPSRDVNVGVPDERHVAHQGPQRQRQRKARHLASAARLRRQRGANDEPERPALHQASRTCEDPLRHRRRTGPVLRPPACRSGRHFFPRASPSRGSGPHSHSRLAAQCTPCA